MSEQKIAELVAAGKSVRTRLPKSLKLSAHEKANWETLKAYRSAELPVALTTRSGWVMRSGQFVDLLQIGMVQIRHDDGTTSSIYIGRIEAITV